MLRGLTAIIYKEWIQVRRDPATFFVFLIPTIQTIIFGFAINMDVQHIPTAVYDLDQSRESRRFMERFQNTNTFDILEEVYNTKDLRRAIVAGNVRVGLVIPENYQASLIRGEPVAIQVLVDGSDSTVAMNAIQTAQYIGLIQSMVLNRVNSSQLLVDIRPYVLFNPDLESARFYIPGLIGIILQLVTVFLTAFSIVRERERGTLEQLMVTPVSRGALILGKIFPYSILGMFQTVFVLLIMRIIFQVSISGDLFLLLSLSALFLLPSLALGILISSVAVNQAQAMQMGLFVMLPSILLSGFAFPRETMPLPIYGFSNLIPVTYYIQILRGIILRGAGFAELWTQTFMLAIFAFVLVFFSISRFQKRLT